MAMYIYASLPKSYGSFYQIQQDNYPFNRIFHKYIQQIVTIGIENNLDIFSLIGYVEHGLAGEERLPDTPEGDRPITFRFSIEDEMIEQYYKDQDLSNKMITQMIVRMTIRLADEYGTSLSRLATMIGNIKDFNGRSDSVVEVTDRKQDVRPTIKARPDKKVKPAIRISEQEQREELAVKETIEEAKESVKEKQKVIDPKEKVPNPSAEAERLKKKLEELQKKQAVIEGDTTERIADNESKVVTTSPHLANFFG